MLFPFSAKPQSQSGHTLIELSVVLVLMGTLIAVGAPSVAGYFRGQGIEQSVDMVFSQMDFARHRAVSQNNPQEIAFGSPAANQITIHDDDNADGIVDAGEAVRVLELSGAVAFGAQDLLGDARIIFMPSGMLQQGQGGTITLAEPHGREATLEIFASGQANRQEGT